jgi:hypothetical protein
MPFASARAAALRAEMEREIKMANGERGLGYQQHGMDDFMWELEVEEYGAMSICESREDEGVDTRMCLSVRIGDESTDSAFPDQFEDVLLDDDQADELMQVIEAYLKHKNYSPTPPGVNYAFVLEPKKEVAGETPREVSDIREFMKEKKLTGAARTATAHLAECPELAKQRPTLTPTLVVDVQADRVNDAAGRVEHKLRQEGEGQLVMTRVCRSCIGGHDSAKL